MATPASRTRPTRQLQGVGGYTGIPYTPSRSLGVGGYTGIPYTPTRQLQSVGGYTGIPYTPTRVEAPEQLPGLHGGSGASGGGAASNRLRMAR